jgi:O-antigen/teichoic acid export membrane protein
MSTDSSKDTPDHHPSRPSLNNSKDDSLRKRYLYKLSTNLAALGMNLVTQAIIPRGLGPRAYGDFNFLTSFFSQITGFLDSGTSVALYTKLSCRPHDSGLVRFYLYFVGIASLIMLLLVLGVTLTPLASVLWPGQRIIYVYLAALFALLLWTSQVLNQMADACGLTVRSEVARLSQKALALVLILVLFAMGWLYLTSFFLYNYAILLFLVVAFAWIIRRWRQRSDLNTRLSVGDARGYARELCEYSHPLIVYALIGLIANIVDRWLLQYFGGSVEQGFFGLSFQIGSICIAFTTAMTPLLLREFSIAYEDKDLNRMSHLFRRSALLLYSVAAYFSCFIALQSDKVIYLMGGDKFRDAARAVAIMSLYPVHQTYGQLAGSVMYAAGRTKLYRNAGTIFLVAGIPLTYFFVAPAAQLGFNGGATGLALKMVLLQFVSVNVLLFYSTKLLNLSFGKFLGHQLAVLATLFALAAIVTILTDLLLEPIKTAVIRFLAAGLAYTLCAGILAYLIPSLFGLSHEDLNFLRRPRTLT